MLALALVIALGAMGVGYAAWTDTIYIEGVVYTGSLDADISGVSSTFVYKVPVPDTDPVEWDIQVDYVYGDSGPSVPAGGTLVAQATTVDNSDADEDDDSATMTFVGVFPGIDFMTDVELKYLGSVPARISFAEVAPLPEDDPDYIEAEADILQALWDLGVSHTEGIWIDAELSTDGGENWSEDPVDPLTLQLHFEDLVHISVHVLLPEGTEYENLSLDFTALITVIQWNE